MSRLGDSIKNARISAGLTEKALGKKCGLAERFIKDVESGGRIVSDEQAKRILKVLGVKDPVSTELEVAAEPPVKLRPRPKPYVLVKTEEPEKEGEREANDLWLDALSGVVKRVPIVSEDSVVIDHVLTPLVGGKIEGGNPEKVLYFRCPDDSMRGFRIYAGDLLLTVPGDTPIDDQVMLVEMNGVRAARKVLKQEGNKVLIQSYDRELTLVRAARNDVKIVGRCVKLERRL